MDRKRFLLVMKMTSIIAGFSKCKDLNCKKEIKICLICGRPMVDREGAFGGFCGCSGYGLQDDKWFYKEKYAIN